MARTTPYAIWATSRVTPLTTGNRECALDDYLSKPLRATLLRRAIAHACASPRDATRPTEPTRPENTPLNWASALNAVDGDRALLWRVVSTALDECPTLLRDLDLAIAAGSASEIRRLAHSVKGALRLFEDGGVTKFAEQLEGMGTTNRLDGATDVLASLHRAVNEVMQMLRQFRP